MVCHTIQYYSVKQNESKPKYPVIHATTWMNSKNMLSEKKLGKKREYPI